MSRQSRFALSEAEKDRLSAGHPAIDAQEEEWADLEGQEIDRQDGGTALLPGDGGLGDEQIPLAQRRTLVAQMGEIQGNRHVQRLVAEATIQRQGDSTDEKTASAPATAPTAAPGAAAATTAKGKTVDITFMADYHEVPGIGKDRVAPRQTDDALWFDPLALHSNVPARSNTMVSKGVVAGAGQQQIDTASVPVTEGDAPVGTGSVTPAMRFANSLEASFDVDITLPKDLEKKKGSAKSIAKKFLQEQMPLFGDIDVLETRTVDYLAQNGFPGATVKLKISKNKTNEVGQSTFFYRVHNNTGLLMEILAQPEGEKRTEWSKTEGGSHGAEKESERHGEHKVETVDVEYAKNVVDTLNEYVKRVDESRSELISKLSDQIVESDTTTSHENSFSKAVEGKTEDLDKTVKSHTESGEKEKKNWAAKLKGPVGWLKKLITVPYVDRVPFLRKLKSWELDLVDAGLDYFKVEGKVPYSDTTETTTGKQTTKDVKDVHGSDDIVIKSHGKEERKRELKETVKSHSESEYSHFKQRVEDTKETYSKVAKMESGGGSDRGKETSSTTTSVTFSGNTTWKFTEPAVKATVVSGDGEVSDKPIKENS